MSTATITKATETTAPLSWQGEAVSAVARYIHKAYPDEQVVKLAYDEVAFPIITRNEKEKAYNFYLVKYRGLADKGLPEELKRADVEAMMVDYLLDSENFVDMSIYVHSAAVLNLGSDRALLRIHRNMLEDSHYE